MKKYLKFYNFFVYFLMIIISSSIVFATLSHTITQPEDLIQTTNSNVLIRWRVNSTINSSINTSVYILNKNNVTVTCTNATYCNTTISNLADGTYSWYLNSTENTSKYNTTSIRYFKVRATQTVELFKWGNGSRTVMTLDRDYGNLSIVGNMTARYFVGDGSKLTNVGVYNTSWNESHASSLYISQSDEGNLNVNHSETTNSSDYWDNLNTINSSQMQDSGGTLSIIGSWFSSLFNTLFSAKDTDDLTEGSTNLYDNSSWNQSHASSLFATISNLLLKASHGNVIDNRSASESYTNQNIIDNSTADRTYTDGNIISNVSYLNSNIIDNLTASKVYTDKNIVSNKTYLLFKIDDNATFRDNQDIALRGWINDNATASDNADIAIIATVVTNATTSDNEDIRIIATIRTNETYSNSEDDAITATIVTNATKRDLINTSSNIQSFITTAYLNTIGFNITSDILSYVSGLYATITNFNRLETNVVNNATELNEKIVTNATFSDNADTDIRSDYFNLSQDETAEGTIIFNGAVYFRDNVTIQTPNSGEANETFVVTDLVGNAKILLNGSGDSWFMSENLGVGTQSPNTKLGLNGSMHISGSMNISGVINQTTAGTIRNLNSCTEVSNSTGWYMIC